jgi:glycosyltransferase involved in cell wall biosynthesis
MKQRLKIAFFLDNFYPQINGVVTSSLNTIFELSKRGHEIFGVVPKTNHKTLNFPNDYFPFQFQSHKGFSAFLYPDFIFTYPFSQKVIKAMKKFKPDIIHFHAPLTIGYKAIRCAKKFKIPVVGTFHTFFAEPEYLSVIGMEKSKFLYNSAWIYSNQFFNRCDAVISPAKATAKILNEKNNTSKIHIIANGVEVQKYKKYNFNYTKFPLKIKKNEEWILYIGRISKEKCLDVLFDAVSIAMKKRSNLKFLIIGDGPNKNEIQKKCIEKKIIHRTYFSGMISNKDLLESGIIKKMKLFVTASTSENQPMTILESLMFGLPIVGVDAKGIPELINGNGFIVPPNNPEIMAAKILKILEDKSIQKKFSKKSLDLSKKYDIKLTTNKIEELYYMLINKSLKN